VATRPSACAASLLVGLAAAASAQEDAERSYPDGVVAVVEGEPITRHELELACRLDEEYQSLPAGDTKARHEVQRRQLDVLIREKVLLLRAEADGVDLSPPDERRLDRAVARMAEAYRGEEGLRRALAREGVPYDYFVARHRTSLLIDKLLLQAVSREIFVSPAQIRRFYREHEGRFSHEGETRIRRIDVYPDPAVAYRVPSEVAARVEAEAWDPAAYAEELRARVLAGEPFAEVAEQGSMGAKFDTDEVFPSGFDLQESFLPPLGATIERLEVGAVSEVLRTERGTYHVVILVDRREPGVLPLPEVQGEIERTLQNEIYATRRQDWIDQVMADAYVRTWLPAPQ